MVEGKSKPTPRYYLFYFLKEKWLGEETHSHLYRSFKKKICQLNFLFVSRPFNFSVHSQQFPVILRPFPVNSRVYFRSFSVVLRPFPISGRFRMHLRHLLLRLQFMVHAFIIFVSHFVNLLCWA